MIGRLQCYHFGTNINVLANFTSWSDLRKGLNNSNLSAFTTNSSELSLHPAKPIILTSEIEIWQLAAVKTGVSNQNLTLNIIGLSGLEVAQWSNQAGFSSATLFIENSKVEFYVNGTKASNLGCSSNLLLPFHSPHKPPSSQLNFSLFNVFTSIYFAHNNIYSADPICPYIFSNVNMNTICIFSQIDTFLMANLWRFQTATELIPLNSTISDYKINGYGYRLDTQVLDPLVFESLLYLSIFESIGSIQNDLFGNFQQILSIQFTLYSFRNFFHKIGIAWTLHLNSSLQQRLVAFTKAHSSWIVGAEYTYPDRDFCIFAQHLLQSAVLFVLDSPTLTECTTTIELILSNYYLYNISLIFNQWSYSDRIYSICLNSSNRTTNFTNRISQCNLTENRGATTLYAEYHQVQFIVEFIQDLVIFIAIPCACFLGLLLNIIIIRTVHKNKKKDLKDTFYVYMSINAGFNCAYCVIFLFYPINSCVNIQSGGYFCSSIRASVVTQLYKIVFVAYFGEAIKMCANIFYILMNVNRYMLIGDKHNPTLEKISKWDIAWVVGISIGISLLLNVGHAFQYNLNELTIYIDDPYGFTYLYQIYPYIYAYSFLSIQIYLIVYFVINFLIFFIVSTAVDVIIVRKLHAALEDKKTKTKDMKAHVSADTISFRKKRKLEIEDRSEERAVLMVVVNALFSFFLRLPELLVVLSGSPMLFGTVLAYFFDLFSSILEFATDVYYLAYILTFSTNFLIYYLFNMKFKETFYEYRNVKKRN
jgi:hypothetical protein